MANAEPASTGGSPPWTRVALGALVVVLAGLGVVAAVFAFAGDEDALASDAAELVPADAHLFVGFNFDLTSEPWVALPRLLDALNVERQARDELDESFAEEGIDFEREVLPIIGDITSIAFAGQALNLEEGEGVFAVATRDVNALLAFLQDNPDEDVEVSTTDDRRSGLSFVDFTDPEDGSQVSFTSRDGVVYVGIGVDNPAARQAVVSHLERLERLGPLSDHEEFRALFGETGGTPLIALWASGAAADAIDDREFSEGRQSFEEQAEIDISSFRLAMALLVERDGFRVDSIWRAPASASSSRRWPSARTSTPPRRPCRRVRSTSRRKPGSVRASRRSSKGWRARTTASARTPWIRSSSSSGTPASTWSWTWPPTSSARR